MGDAHAPDYRRARRTARALECARLCRDTHGVVFGRNGHLRVPDLRGNATGAAGAIGTGSIRSTSGFGPANGGSGRHRYSFPAPPSFPLTSFRQ